MNFHILGPVNYLNILGLQDYKYHMCLAQHCYDKDWTPTDYFFYYKRRAALHKYVVILDNGAYEGQPVDYQLLLRCTLELNPDVVVLPDIPHNMAATLGGGEAFKALLKQHKWEGKTMTVVHAEPGNLDQFCHSYMEACKQSLWVGVSRLTEDFGSGNNLYRRCDFMKTLYERKLYNTHTVHHALGMRDGSVKELKALKEYGINSVDSSAPLWRGLHDHTLQETPTIWQACGTAFDPLECSDRWSSKAQSQALLNLEEVTEACK